MFLRNNPEVDVVLHHYKLMLSVKHLLKTDVSSFLHYSKKASAVLHPHPPQIWTSPIQNKQSSSLLDDFEQTPSTEQTIKFISLYLSTMSKVERPTASCRHQDVPHLQLRHLQPQLLHLQPLLPTCCSTVKNDLKNGCKDSLHLTPSSRPNKSGYDILNNAYGCSPWISDKHSITQI